MKKLFAGLLIIVAFFISTNVYALISEDGDCDWDEANTCRMGSTRHYKTWQSFWDDIEALTGDITLLVDQQTFLESTYPASFTVDLNGYTIRVKPEYPAYYPASTDGTTGPRFLTQYSTSDEFINLGPTDTGNIIIEGINVLYSSGTCPTAFFYITGAGTSTFTLKRSILKGDGTTANVEGIYVVTSSTININILNNYIFNFEDGIYIAGGTATRNIYNNTFNGNYLTGINCGATVNNIVNNLVYATNPGNDYYLTTSAYGFNNLCEDATCANANWSYGEGNQSSKTVTFTSEYFLASSEADAIDLGTFPNAGSFLAWWRFEYGSKTADSKGSYTLTAQGAPTDSFDAKEGYGSAYFAQNTSYILPKASLGSGFPGYSANGKDMTVMLNYKPNNTAEAYLASYFTWYIGEANYRWAIRKDAAGTVAFWIDDVGGNFLTATTTATLSSGTNYHISASYDKDSPYTYNIRIWNVDTDKLVENKTGTFAAFSDVTADSDFYINAWLTGNDEAGTIDDVRIYTSVLTTGEIDFIRMIKHDAFGRPRDATPDIGAYEYVPARAFYIDSDEADNSKSGLVNNAWKDFTNLDYRILNPGDAIYLDKGETFNDKLSTRMVGAVATPITIGAYGTGVSPIIDSDGGQAAGMYFVNANYVTIDGLTIRDFTYAGIYAVQCDGMTVQNCTFSTTYGGANWIQGIYMGGQAGNYSDDININNNTVSTMTSSDWGEGIYVTYGDGVSIANNSLSYGCTDDTCNVRGITLENSINATITENTTNGTATGIGLYACGVTGSTDVITRNTVVNSYGVGIYEEGAADDPGPAIEGDATIKWNTIYGGEGCGIAVKYKDNVDIIENLVYDRGLWRTTYDLYNGIDINHASKDGMLLNNTVYKAAGACATIEAFSIYPCTGWIMKNNIFDGYNNTQVDSGSILAFYYEYNGVGESGDQNLNSDYNLFSKHNSGTWNEIGTYLPDVQGGSTTRSLSSWQTLQGTTYGQTDYDTYSIVMMDPLFVNPSNSVFDLASNSPCVDNGVNVSALIGCTSGVNCYDMDGIIVPKDGNRSATAEWDMGAYELHVIMPKMMNNYNNRRRTQ